MNFFTSDTHFCDIAAVERDNGLFQSVEEMNNTIINNINKVATENDVLYHLGDFAPYRLRGDNEIWREGYQYIKLIRPKVILILGNHDEKCLKWEFNEDKEEFTKYCKGLGFAEVYFDELKVETENRTFICRHIPKSEVEEGCVQLYGHVHRLIGNGMVPGFCVSQDTNFFRPYSEEDLAKSIKLYRKAFRELVRSNIITKVEGEERKYEISH